MIRTVLHIGILLAVTSSTVSAKEIVVSPSEKGEPVLAAAVKDAADGDTIRVKKGLYPETIVIDKRIAIVGEDGAVLDPSQPFAPPWKPAPDIAKGAYSAKVKQRPRALMLDGKIVAEIDETRATGDGDWSAKQLLSTGGVRGGYKYIRAIWMYSKSKQSIEIHMESDADPGPLKWSAIFDTSAVVAFHGANGASISGLTLAHGYDAVGIGDKSQNCTVSKCTITSYEKTGISLSGDCNDCLVEYNDVTRGAYEDWAPGENSKDRYEIWKVHKTAGFYDRVGINLFRAGTNNRIHANHVHETFDGIDIGDYSIESLDKPITSPDQCKGTEIWENVIERTRDSGIELGTACIDVRIHHNILRQTHGGLRFKLPRVGPVFIYRNVLVGASPFNIWFSIDDSPAEGYVYNNTIVGGKTALLFSSFTKTHNVGAPNWHFVNNIFATERGFFEDHGTSAPVNFTADYNIVTGADHPWPADAGKEKNSKYVEKIELDDAFHPAPDSPAIDAGLDLSTYYKGKPLPGCEPGYFKGKAPDAGAFEVK